jgi:di/tricarboxylate transporter
MPSTKVTAGVLAGAVTTVILWIVEASTSIDVPALVAAAIVVVVTFVLQYFIPETNPAPSAEAAMARRNREAPLAGTGRSTTTPIPPTTPVPPPDPGI